MRSIYNVETVRDGALIRLKVSVDGMSEYPDAAYYIRLYDETCHYNMMSDIIWLQRVYTVRVPTAWGPHSHTTTKIY